MRVPVLAIVAIAVAACERAPNYNAGIPGGRSNPVDPDAGAVRAPAASAPAASPAAGEAPATAAAQQPASPAPTEPQREALASAPKQYDELPSEAPGLGAGVPAGGVSAPPTNAPNAPAAPPIDEVRRHAASKRFDEIRAMSKRFRDLQRELRALGERLAQGPNEADQKRYARLEKEAEGEWPRLRAYIWDDRWSEFDRAAMGLVIYGE